MKNQEGNDRSRKTEENEKMKCDECGRKKDALKLSPAVIDNKLRLVCRDCWKFAVETEKATIFDEEEMTAFSELQ